MQAHRSPRHTLDSGRLSRGDVFVDRFEVRDFLGAGGEFDVYLAFDRASCEEIALKVLVLPGDPRFGQTVASTVADDLAARRDGLDALVRLHRETLDSIDHDVAIARVYEASHEGEPRDWFVVEEAVHAAFTLGDWLRIEKDERVVRAALGSLGRLLSQLHERGVVHRDVHGGNVLVDARGRLWFTDFSHAIRPLHRGAFALLSPWNAPEERSDTPLTASADVYGFAKLVLSVLARQAQRAPTATERASLHDRLEALRARWIDCAPEARGSLVSLLDELSSIDRALLLRPVRSRRRALGWAAAAAILTGLSAWAMHVSDRASPSSGAGSVIPVTVVRIHGEASPLEWRDEAPRAPSSAIVASASEPAPSPTRPARRMDFARGSVGFRADAPASERLADYAASEFLREARLRASKGWGAACLRAHGAGAAASGEATFRVTLSPASDARGGRVDGVDVVRARGIDARVAQCLRARIANIAAADPGQTIATELSLRVSDDRPLARR